MKTPKDGGPAFPIYQQPHPEMSFTIAQAGISRRDYFAAAALTGLLACPDGFIVENVPKRAFAFADAMIAESEETA